MNKDRPIHLFTLSPFFLFSFILLLLLSSACSSPSPTASHPSNNSRPPTPQQKSAPDERQPLVRILRQAEKVRSRLRFFAEEIKTTYKPEKQAALLANVQDTVHPACQEMKNIIDSSEELKQSNTAMDMEAVCVRIDTALEKRDLNLLQPELHEFNTAFERLQRAALGNN